jgi:hypothetical protein
MSTSMKSARHKLIRAATAFAAAGLLGACNGLSREDLNSIYELGKGMVSRGRSVTLQEAAAVPYATIGVRMGGSSETMLVLASDSNGLLLWTSSLHIAITTRNGRIVETTGLRYNIRMQETQSGAPGEDGGRTIRRQADLPELGLYSVAITCRSRSLGEETITILGKDIRTQRTEEKCEADTPRFNWSFRNVYWTDPEDGFVWRSIQHVNPELDAVEIEVLRPPG